MCSFVSATASKNAAFVIVLSAGGVGGAVSDIDTSPNGNVGADAGCSALTRSSRHSLAFRQRRRDVAAV